jgi:NAD(P)-dependent dehydrogenase (short-subunit alcohol dehydrogenase family)
MSSRRPFPLFRRTVVVTGASAGVGRATALRFARAGAHVGVIGRDEAALAEVAADIDALGSIACIAPADVANAGEVFAAADKIAHALGPIEVWVNNAMVTVSSPFADITPEEFRRVTEVTYLGCVHGTQAALRHMRPHNRGTIVQVGSALAYRGIPLQAAYCGAKHAIRGFTDSLRCELIHDSSGIELTIVELPAVNTPQFDWARTHLPHQPRPVPPVVQPEVIADAIYRAALRPLREYWIGRSTFEVILANVLLPAVLDRILARKAFSGQMTKVPVTPNRRNNLVAPVHDLHRTRGSFGAEAARSAMIVSGPAARIGAVIAAATLAFCAGALAQRGLLQSLRTRS